MRPIFGGAGVALLLSFPAAAFVGLVWRFPVPLTGYTEGIDALWTAPMAVFFYMAPGGIVVVPIGGAAVTLLAIRIDSDREDGLTSTRLIWLSGGVTALAFALLLAGLEFLIGVW